MLSLILSIFLSTVAIAGTHDDLEKCYQAHGQIEEVQGNGKKITTYKSPEQVAAECNEKVVAKAKGVTSVATINELASIIGRNSNWQSALPVYTAGAKADPKRAICPDSDAWRHAILALSSPEGHPHSRGALGFFDACWSVMKADIVDLLEADSSSYHKVHLCKFLREKKALPPKKESFCR